MTENYAKSVDILGIKLFELSDRKKIVTKYVQEQTLFLTIEV